MLERFLSARKPLYFFFVADGLMILVLAVAAIAAWGAFPSELPATESSAGVHAPADEDGHRLIEAVPSGFLRELARQLDLNEEMNLATALSAVQFLFAAALAWYVGKRADIKATWLRSAWIVIALGLLFLMAEELFEIHEFIGSLFPEGDAYSLGPFTWSGRSRWVLLYIVPLAFAGAFVVFVFMQTFAGVFRSHLLSWAGLACWGAAVACESLMNAVPRHLVRTEIFFEESLEIAGVLLLILSFRYYLKSAEQKSTA